LNTVNGAPVPGAPATAVASTAASTTPTTETRSATRNFELDKTISHTRKSPGKVQRLSVAVLVDNLPKANDKGVLVPTALTDAEIAKVQALVREAVGFDEKRGDTVTVQNAAFMPNEALAPIAPLPIWQQPEMRDYARQGLGALVVLLIALLVVRPMLKSLMSPSAPRTVDAVLEQMAERKAQLAVGGEMTGEVLGDRLSLSSAPEVPKVYEQKLVQARAAVAQDPKRVAQLVKNWIGSEG